MHLIRAIILTGIILSAAAYEAAQQATPPKQDAANVTDAVYANECLALTYRLPDGWKFQKIAAPQPDQSKQQMVLFKAKPASADASNEWLEIKLLQTPLKHPFLVRFNTLMELTLVQGAPEDTKVTRTAYAVTVAGRDFARSDFATRHGALALFSTWYRGYVLTAWASADSPQNLEDIAKALNTLSFGEDKRTAECFDSPNQASSVR
jgi:hypothetical protein